MVKTSTSLNVPLTLPCGATLPNRLAKSAMSEALGTPSQGPSEALATLYGRWGRGGLGLLITGNVMIDRRALGEPGNVALEEGDGLDGFAHWAQAAKAHGTPCYVQLNHPGRQVPRGLNREAVAPSAVPMRRDMAALFPTPRALTETEVYGLVERFATSAGLCQHAGFDGVQIHGAHGYLVSQFLSPLTNQRSDAFGGTPERRRRFVLEVYRAMRERVGPSYPLSIKLNSADFQRGGFSEEESLDTVVALAEAGIDLLEISGGTYESPKMTGVSQRTAEREAYFLQFAERVRQVSRVPLMVTGGFRTLGGMEQALSSGATDVIGLARPLAIEPDLALRLLSGREAAHPISTVRTGIGLVDKLGMLEMVFYGRQLRRMGRGKEPLPNAGALASLGVELLDNGTRLWRNRSARG